MYKDHSASSPFLQSLLQGVNVRQAVVLCILNLLCFLIALALLNSNSSSSSSSLPSLTRPDSALVGAQAGGLVSPLSCPPPPAPLPLPQPRNAIVGLASNVAYTFLYHFVRSAREVCPLCTILLYLPTKDVSDQVKSLVKYFKVDVYEYDALLASYPAKHQSFHPSSYRWMLMYDHLSSITPAPYDALFMTDVRDTVFLRDPFTAIMTQGDGLYVAMESAHVPIAQEGWNSGWIRDCFGDPMVQKVGREVVSCSGTTLGTWDAALAYLKTIAGLIREHESCERNGIDQGVHNVIVHTRLMAPHAVYPQTNEKGLIATVQSMPTLRRNEWGYVVNEAGETVSVVHQVDRSKLLISQYDMQYPVIPEQQRSSK